MFREIVQQAKAKYSFRISNMCAMDNHLWYDRFTSKVSSSLRLFMATFAYIGDNPIPAHLFARGTDYPYGEHA